MNTIPCPHCKAIVPLVLVKNDVCPKCMADIRFTILTPQLPASPGDSNSTPPPFIPPTESKSPDFAAPTSPQLHTVGGRPINLYCPHCSVELQLQPQNAGDVASCPSCGGRFQTPMPLAGTTRTTGGYHREEQFNPGIKVCVLISGISNILLGIFWITTLCGVVIGIPQIVLAIFEIIYFAQADKKPLRDALSQAKLLGIFEIILGLFNWISFVCGILVLVFASNERK